MIPIYDDRKTRGREKPKESPLAEHVRLFPWRYVAVAAVPLGLLSYYLTQVAPGLVPVPAGVSTAFPPLTRFLEGICAWCGANQALTIAAAAGLLLAGTPARYRPARYYVLLAILATMTLGLTFYTISAPVDKVLQAVEDNIPKDYRVPSAQRQ